MIASVYRPIVLANVLARKDNNLSLANEKDTTAKNPKFQRFQVLPSIFQVKIKRCHRVFPAGVRDLNYISSVCD